LCGEVKEVKLQTTSFHLDHFAHFHFDFFQCFGCSLMILLRRVCRLSLSPASASPSFEFFISPARFSFGNRSADSSNCTEELLTAPGFLSYIVAFFRLVVAHSEAKILRFALFSIPLLRRTASRCFGAN